MKASLEEVQYILAAPCDRYPDDLDAISAADAVLLLARDQGRHTIVVGPPRA